MSKRTLPLTGLLIACAIAANGPLIPPAAAQTPPAAAAPPVDADKVQALLKLLTDADGAARKTAADGLVAMGAGAKPAIEEFAKKADDRKAKLRAEGVLARIDNAIAESAAPNANAPGSVANNLAGTLITLDLVDVDAADAFDALFAQAKSEYATQPSNALTDKDNIAPVTLKYDKAPFWTVLRDLCKQTGLNLYNTGEATNRLMFSTSGDREWQSSPSVVSGAFLISARSINFNQSINLARPDDSNTSLSVQFNAYPEPSLRVVRSNYQLKLDEAVDDEGNSLLPPSDNNSGWNSGRQSVWNFQSPLDPKAATGNKITKLRGTATFGAIAESVRIEVPDAMNVKDFKQKAGQVQVAIKDLKKRDGGGNSYEQYTLRIAITRPPRNNDNEMFNYGPQGLRVLDAKGRELSGQGYSGGGGGPEGHEYTMTFGRYSRGGDGEKPGVPDKIVWEIPTKIVDVKVPFEFKDLPLP